jgi:hypothetical protein
MISFEYGRTAIDKLYTHLFMSQVNVYALGNPFIEHPPSQKPS